MAVKQLAHLGVAVRAGQRHVRHINRRQGHAATRRKEAALGVQGVQCNAAAGPPRVLCSSQQQPSPRLRRHVARRCLCRLLMHQLQDGATTTCKEGEPSTAWLKNGH